MDIHDSRTVADFQKFIDDLNVTPKIKTELKKITPQNYIGIANKF